MKANITEVNSMIEIYFTSDSHFGHKNILEYEKEARPFETIQEMHEVMIERWNSVVKPKDIIYHLGDFAFGRQNISLAANLNGCKRLILGNHDTYPTAEYLKYFDKLYGVVFLERCILSHIPVHPNSLGSRWLLNIHGHLHSRRVQTAVCGWHEVQSDQHPLPILVRKPFDGEFEDDQRYFNVSCEQNNLTPIHRDVIMKRLKEIKSRD